MHKKGIYAIQWTCVFSAHNLATFVVTIWLKMIQQMDFCFLHCLQPIYSIFRLNEFGLSCCLQHWALSGQFSLPISLNALLYSNNQTTDHTEYFYVYYEKCLWCSSVANVNNNSNIEWSGLCVCVILLLWFCILVKFSLDWLAHGICKGAFIHNPFSIKLNRKWLFGEPKANSTPFAAYLDIWSLWCVCLIFHYVCSNDAHDKYVYTTHIQYGHDAMKRWLCSGDRLKMKCSFDQQFNNNNSMANYDFTMARFSSIRWYSFTKSICQLAIRIFVWQMQDCCWLIRTLFFVIIQNTI